MSTPSPASLPAAIIAVAAVAAAGLVACDTGTGAGGSVIVSDSAGIRIVENGQVAGVEAPFGFGDEPLFRVGWDAGGVEFGRVQAGVLLSGGRAAVVDGQLRQLFVLSPSGEVEAVLGGSGEGPGEFGSIASVMRLGRDTVAVQDMGNGRVTLFHGGELLGSAPGPGDIFSWHMAFGADGEGRMLMALPFAFSPNFPEPWLRMPVSRQDLSTGGVDTIAWFDWSQNMEDRADNPFSPGGRVTAAGGEPVVARSDIAELRWLDDTGEPRQIARWAGEREAVTDAFWEAYQKRYRDRVSANLPDDTVQAWLARYRVGARQPLPLFRQLLGASDGTVWLGEYGPDERFSDRWNVVAADGQWLGTVEPPPRFQILDVHEGLVLGIERDPFDVEAVAVYRLEGWRDDG